MAEIRILSTCSIRPATAESGSGNESLTHERIIELTPWDLKFLMVGPIQKGLLFIKPPAPVHQQKGKDDSEEYNISTTIHDHDDLIDHLKTSLSRTLDFFPPLAGRLTATENNHDNTTFFSLHCNNAGVQFTHATVVNNLLTVSDILEPIYVPRIVNSFFPLNGVHHNHEGISKPLFAVQVTELVDGFFIGCTMNHSVGDGTSFWHFFNSWSEISRGFNYISKPPVLKRWFPSNDDIPIPSQQLLINSTTDQPIVVLEARVFHFTKSNIRKLKEKANIEMGTDRISSLQALLAHLWRSVTRCRLVDCNQETNLTFPVGARQRLRPQLPEGYFGNVVNFVGVKNTASELLQHGLGWAAWQLNQIIALQTHEQVIKFYESWVKNPNVQKMGALVSNAALPMLMSSCPRFNVYGNDFGWGKPVAVRSGTGNKFDGKATVFPGVEEGSIDIELCLMPETLHALGNEKEFMEAVSTI